MCLFLFLTAEFTVQPVSVERAEGLEAVFSCQYQEERVTVTYDWVINNTIVATDTETVRARRPSSPGGPATLTILTTPQHNNSVVYCEAIIRNGSDHTFVISSLASLVVRGESVIMPRCACASEVYGSVFVCLCVCVDCYSCSRMNQVQVKNL